MIERTYHIREALPELYELESLIEEGQKVLRVSVAEHIPVDGMKLPIYALEMGSRSPEAPTLALVGGIHGIERIGTQVILAYLKTLLRQREWDRELDQMLNSVRLLLIPIVNPGGMLKCSRANPNGVDLMRNAPVEADAKTPWLVGGQRISSRLPWYRGRKQDGMERESQAIIDVISKTLFSQKTCIAMDCHSGFGIRDRVWFPWAKSHAPWPDAGNVYGLTQLFEHTYPHHDLYLFEPQSHSYTTHGDLWDYMYEGYRKANPAGTFLPLTLEMGSWLWVKKNPRLMFRYHSLFNPVLPHRLQRILRRHLTLFEFLLAAVSNADHWMPQTAGERDKLQQSAIARWYPKYVETPARESGKDSDKKTHILTP